MRSEEWGMRIIRVYSDSETPSEMARLIVGNVEVFTVDSPSFPPAYN